MTDSELEEEQTPDDLFRTAVLVEGGLGAIALLLGYLVGPSARALIPSAEQVATIAGGVGLGVLATIPLLLFMSVLRRIKHPAIDKLDELSDHPMIELMLKLGPIELLIISLCAGVGEELLFRGWLLPFLGDLFNGHFTSDVASISLLPSDPTVERPWWAFGGFASAMAFDSGSWTIPELVDWWSNHVGWPMTTAWIVSSVVFGFVHPMTKLYIFVTGMMGLYFGALMLLSGNLLIPMIAHALYDAIQLWSASAEAKQTELASKSAI